MGSSPPFLYDRPATYSLCGPTDPEFNPKAVTQASWRIPEPKEKPTGPLISFNKHPDTWGGFDNRSTWTPMHPNTKKRVTRTRHIQLGLRIITLIGSLGSLFFSVVITQASARMIWIIRAAPIAAILHTIYAIYTLCQSPITRPTGSQASYAVFASILDLGIIPFYVFTAYISHAEYTMQDYGWGTFFNSAAIKFEIVEGMFIVAIVNGALHLVSLALSIYLAVAFHKISQLPPDMNPLEDNLTALPRKTRKGIEADEKHWSSSTLQSNLEDPYDPLIGPPRTVPFIHTRGLSIGGDSSKGSFETNEKRTSVLSFQQHRHRHRLSQMEPHSPHSPLSPDTFYDHTALQPLDLTSHSGKPEYRNVASHSPEFVDATTQIRPLSADRSNSVSSVSEENWVTYADGPPSPTSNKQKDDNVNGNAPIRHSSSIYSKTTSSTGSTIRDWFAYGQKPPASIGKAIPESIRGEYTSLAMHEFYGKDEGTREQDLGDTRFNIFPDPEEYEQGFGDGEQKDGLPFNPLMLNPPTPQPPFTEILEETDQVRRIALSDNPNLMSNQKAEPYLSDESIDDFAPATPKHHFYDDLGDDGPRVSRSRDVSVQEDAQKKQSKLVKKRSKMAAYASLKKDDSDDESPLNTRVISSPATKDGDRKGRVVSNSGADAAQSGLVEGVGASLSSYGSYIAGLGVGRRRDVSGKIAEEGRSFHIFDENSAPEQPKSTATTPIRAAGWARFAGL
ncbi:hypothetical protein N7495_000066 [Penicillium taxi]|uniref:uncharacterized protein n=1 Tax=Penicillium taxi TaxID=168475 RepID=UPI002544F3F9|nr:uncharacterized protein N7495_000066 [Penicillium taxi]KAJ5907384.1 hypothetical protein N7495_000066 [Penicillium taxi]